MALCLSFANHAQADLRYFNEERLDDVGIPSDAQFKLGDLALWQAQFARTEGAMDIANSIIDDQNYTSTSDMGKDFVSNPSVNQNINQSINQSINQTVSQAIHSVLSTAKSLIGTPYRFGGTTPSGFDCSGFMQYVFQRAIGVNLPRSSRDMANVGEKVARNELQAGDMVFFAHNGSRISHVGMYVGNERFIHSPSAGKSVEITSMNDKYWQSRFITARRMGLS